jgi:chaperonin GroEL
MKEKKARVEDAMHATKAAVEEGIVPGGGVALLRASKALQQLKLEGDEQIGVNIITRAIEEPMRWIATNAGHEGSIVVQKVQDVKDEEGFNAQTGTYENLVQAGVIDPAKVVRSALQHAASIASFAAAHDRSGHPRRFRKKTRTRRCRAAAWAQACTEKFRSKAWRAAV